jgi:hypothetical protein
MERLVLRMKAGVTQEAASKTVKNLGLRIINSSERLLLIEHNKENIVQALEESDLFRIVTPEVRLHKNSVTVNLSDDSEIDSMSEVELKSKLKEIRNTALWWAAQEDDDRCWLDDIKVLESILPHGKVNFEMPNDLDFIENCILFKKSRCPKNLKVHEW